MNALIAWIGVFAATALPAGQAAPSNTTPKWADLNSALRADADTIGRLFDGGRKDAETAKNADFLNTDFRKGIGSVRTNVLRQETVSFAYFNVLALGAFSAGFTARKQYLGDDEIAGMRGRFMDWAPVADTILIAGVLNICPSFGSYGRLVRRANPDDLKGVRVVLKVGDRIYQPYDQPGDLQYVENAEQNLAGRPMWSSTTATSSGGQSVTVQSFYTTTYVQGYEWYHGTFCVGFKMFDADGSARITSKDHEIEAIVIYGGNERHAKFSLDALKRFIDERSKPR
jgi:hypothetical protein